MSGTVQIHSVPSPCLEGNPLGDPTTRKVPVYLPAAEGPHPVVFLLPAFTNTAAGFLEEDWYGESLPQRLDRLIASGAMAPTVVVMVDGMTALGGNQFLDSSAVGPWATHVVTELVPWAEATLPVLPGPAHRGVAGHSSGGYGALLFGLEHPGVFGGLAAHAPDAYFEYAFAASLPQVVDGLRSVGGLGAFLDGLTRRTWPRFPGPLFHALAIVAVAHFLSPDPECEHGVALPVDLETGLRDEAVLARWRARDPAWMVRGEAVEGLRGLRHLGLDVGARDEYHLHHGTRAIAAALAAQGIPHLATEHEGGHRGVAHRMDTWLPPLAQALRPA